MIRYARDPMERALILVPASSGVRLGGPVLKWRDLTPIYLKNGRLVADPGEGGERRDQRVRRLPEELHNLHHAGGVPRHIGERADVGRRYGKPAGCGRLTRVLTEVPKQRPHYPR